MKKIMILASLMVLVLGMATAPAGAWLYVADNSDTGWQTYTYTYTGSTPFTGTAGFVVSNTIDVYWDSQLLLDNLSQAAGSSSGNKSFETGDYTDFTLVGASNGNVANSAVAPGSGVTYYPTQGSYLSNQMSNNADTSGFLNAYGDPGTNGSILETAISLTNGLSFTFDWTFNAGDYAPWSDFSLFYLKNSEGDIVYSDGLGQLGAVPVPGSMLLLGSGLLGLVAWRRKSLKWFKK